MQSGLLLTEKEVLTGLEDREQKREEVDTERQKQAAQAEANRLKKERDAAKRQ